MYDNNERIRAPSRSPDYDRARRPAKWEVTTDDASLAAVRKYDPPKPDIFRLLGFGCVHTGNVGRLRNSE